MNGYVDIVTEFPILSAMVQFAILGTLGDIVSKWIVKRRMHVPFGWGTAVLKMAEWALLAVFIKYAFAGFHGFVGALKAHHLLPEMGRLGNSFAISVSMNLQFGPFLVIMHRLLDNAIARTRNWQHLDKGFLSLIWFWIPAHTITFILPRPFQIGLAALWSLMLGLILGFYNRQRGD